MYLFDSLVKVGMEAMFCGEPVMEKIERFVRDNRIEVDFMVIEEAAFEAIHKYGETSVGAQEGVASFGRNQNSSV